MSLSVLKIGVSQPATLVRVLAFIKLIREFITTVVVLWKDRK